MAGVVWFCTKEEGVTQVKLAEHAKTDPMMTSQVIRALESKGLVERKKHPKDSRALLVGPTEEGRELARQAIPVVEQVDHDFFEKVENSEELITALQSLVSPAQ